MTSSETQSKEDREKVLKSAPAGSGSATGQAKENLSGAEDERLSGADKREAPQDVPQTGDFARVQLDEPAGLQAEPASFTNDGAIPGGFVSSPGGYVPLSAVSDPDEALERTLTANGRNPDDRKLTEDEVEGLSGAEARAIATQRGYAPPDMAGSRTQKRLLLEKQAEDPRFKGSEKKGIVARALGNG